MSLKNKELPKAAQARGSLKSKERIALKVFRKGLVL